MTASTKTTPQRPSPKRQAPSRVTGLATSHPFMPDGFVQKAMEALPAALNTAMPLRSAHRADLSEAIRELSSILTTDRGNLVRPYWSSPRLVSAYLRYFLPWNLLRFNRLLRTLPLTLPMDGDPVLLDLGSGPLSLPMALWLSLPSWRKAPVRLICADTSPHPMELGMTVFKTLASILKEPFLWDVRQLRQPLLKALALQKTPPALITAGNVLNEWEDRSTEADDTLCDRMHDLAAAVACSIGGRSAALFVEPGTRLGGTLCVNLRKAALDAGLHPVAPCTHEGVCPLIGHRDRGWCHLHEGLSEKAVPVWLQKLAEQARLPKITLSCAHIMLTPEPMSNAHGGAPKARLLSDAFLVPQYGLSRYACSGHGLLLIPHAARFDAGSEVTYRLPAKQVIDRKSGALVAEMLD